MRRLMIADGYVATDDPRPDARLTVCASEVAPLISEAGSLVSAKDMVSLLGCSKLQFKTLVGAGLLVSRFPVEVTRRAWKPSDAKVLINELTASAQVISVSKQGWEHIHGASVRARVGINTVVSAVRSGVLKAGKRPDLNGYAGIFVSKDQVDAIIRPERPSAPSAAEFARMVGLHNNGWFKAMIDGGYVSSTTLYNPQTCQHGTYISNDAVAAFHDRFTTVKLLSDRLKIDSRVVSQELRKAGIKRFRPDDLDFGPTFQSEDIADFLRRYRPPSQS